MVLSPFPLLQSTTRMVQYRDTLYKVKIKYNEESFRGKPRNLTEAMAHTEIERCFRAVLYLDERNGQLRTIHSKNFIIKPVKVPWSFPQKYTNYAFERNGVRLKVSQFLFELNISNGENTSEDDSTETEIHTEKISLDLANTAKRQKLDNSENEAVTEPAVSVVQPGYKDSENVPERRFGRTKDGRFFRVAATASSSQSHSKQTNQSSSSENLRKDRKFENCESNSISVQVEKTNIAQKVKEEQKNTKGKNVRRNRKYTRSDSRKYRLRERVRQRRYDQGGKLRTTRVSERLRKTSQRDISDRETDTEGQSTPSNPTKQTNKHNRKELQKPSPVLSVKGVNESLLKARTAKNRNVSTDATESESDLDNENAAVRRMSSRVSRQVHVTRFGISTESEDEDASQSPVKPSHQRRRSSETRHQERSPEKQSTSAKTHHQSTSSKYAKQTKHGLSGSPIRHTVSNSPARNELRNSPRRHPSPNKNSLQHKTIGNREIETGRHERPRRSVRLSQAGDLEAATTDVDTNDDRVNSNNPASVSEELLSSQSGKPQKMKLYDRRHSPQVLLHTVIGSPRVSTVLPVKRATTDQQPSGSSHVTSPLATSTARLTRQVVQQQEEESVRIAHLRDDQATNVYRNFMRMRRDRHTVEMEERAETDKLQQLYQPTGPQQSPRQPHQSPRQPSPRQPLHRRSVHQQQPKQEQSSSRQTRASSNSQRPQRKRSSGLWGAFMDTLVTPTKKYMFGDKK